MNKDNYKKAINQIHASDELKEKTLNRIKQQKVKKFKPNKILALCAMFIIIFLLGTNYTNQDNDTVKESFEFQLSKKEIKMAKEINDLPRFENIEQLKTILNENNLIFNGINEETTGTLEVEQSISKEFASDAASSSKNESLSDLRGDYSTTNVQVESVDEADIVKTDGDYIYYVAQNKVYIIKADTLEILCNIDNAIAASTEQFIPQEVFINKDKLILLGNTNTRYQSITRTEKTSTIEEIAIADVAVVNSKQTAKALIYDISNKSNPVLKREIELDGYYSDSRMIGDNIYFISTKSAYFNSVQEDYEILPICKDTAVSEEIKRVSPENIAYFPETQNHSFTLVAGFNINNSEGMYLETLFGASNTVYCSENNLYLAQIKYEDGWRNTSNTIYKFNLDNSKIVLQCSGNVIGDLNNQFSLDEYDGNLRIATTSYVNNETSNNLYILDENLNEIGKIENLAPGERIYSVRFMGKIGYVVTFKQVDPLFVIDLSEPTNPVVKGELKIPGYSSYLHPYDETHIIGIGYNTRDNGYGGVTNAGLKMSMFDVSDLENPKEMFNTTIGEYYAYSEILYNHKILFNKKSENLIGFPANYRNNSESQYINSFIIFKIDLENGFEKYGEIIRERDAYDESILRAIYIGDTLYTLSSSNIVAYDLNTIEKIKETMFVKNENVTLEE